MHRNFARKKAMDEALKSEANEMSAEFDAFAEGYDEALNRGLRFTGEGKDFFSEGRVKRLARHLSRLGVRVESCLDFGCGTGGSCASLVKGLPMERYLGYDPSAESINEARRDFSIAGVGFESSANKVPVESFDLAFTNGVFHHIPINERRSAVDLVWRALKPGGWFAFWENNRWNPMVHFIMSRVPFDRDAQMLFPHQARRLLGEAGFELARTEFWFVFPALLKALRPLEPSLCRLPLGGQYLILVRKPFSADPSPLS